MSLGLAAASIYHERVRQSYRSTESFLHCMAAKNVSHLIYLQFHKIHGGICLGNIEQVNKIIILIFIC
jgi:hypothetical protein